MLAFVVAASAPARAARPLLDSGTWDAYFALFARDGYVPWKRIAVRLDTYSGAPVDFAAYEIDPTDVLVAGANARPRAIDTAHRKPVVTWRFTPPAGPTFESNDVAVPLGGHEGFFVVEARRGDAAQQVWLNLTRIGLLTKESPGGIVLYGADLGTGRGLPGMRLTYLVGASFVYGATGRAGIARAPARRPRFVLAEWGRSKAFVNFIPVAPVARTVTGVRLDRSTVRPGETVRAVGFARHAAGGALRPASGEAKLSIVGRGRVLAATSARLDAAGAFTGELAIPANAPAGDVVLLAAVDGATGGATLRIDGVGDADITVSAACGTACAPDAEIPLELRAQRAGLPLAGRRLRVRVVRTPHVIPPGTPDGAPEWATTTILDRTVVADAGGAARLALPAPTDGFASTYGVSVQSAAVTVETRIVTPTAPVALSVVPERAQADVGAAVPIALRGFDPSTGAPAAGLAVRVGLQHGPNGQTHAVTLDADGRARTTFRGLLRGTSIVTAEAVAGGKRALDAAAIMAAPRAVAAGGGGPSDDVRIALARPRYRAGERVDVTAALEGASGDALVTLDGVRGFSAQTVPVHAGTVTASVTVPQTVGDIAVGVAFVRDGALAFGIQRVLVDGAGHPRSMTLTAAGPFAPGAVAKVGIGDGAARGNATLVVRLSDVAPLRGADFDDAPALLAATGTTSQNAASDDPAWHAWVAPARSKAGNLFGIERPRAEAPADGPLAAAAPRALVFRVERVAGHSVDVPLPATPGAYVLSVLEIADDGDVGAASLSLTVH